MPSSPVSNYIFLTSIIMLYNKYIIFNLIMLYSKSSISYSNIMFKYAYAIFKIKKAVFQNDIYIKSMIHLSIL